MKINRHELPPNLPGYCMSERFEFINNAKANYAARAQALGHRLANLANIFCHEIGNEIVPICYLLNTPILSGGRTLQDFSPQAAAAFCQHANM
jgi:hypothetical protein